MEFTSVTYSIKNHCIFFSDIQRFAHVDILQHASSVLHFNGDPTFIASFLEAFEHLCAVAQLPDAQMMVQIFLFLDPIVAAQWKQVLAIVNSSYDDFRVQVLFLHPHTAWLSGRIHVSHLSALSLQLKHATYDRVPAL